MLCALGTTVINNETKTDYKKLKDSKVASEGRKKKIKTSLVINNIISIFHPWILLCCSNFSSKYYKEREYVGTQVVRFCLKVSDS